MFQTVSHSPHIYVVVGFLIFLRLHHVDSRLSTDFGYLIFPNVAFQTFSFLDVIGKYAVAKVHQCRNGWVK